MQTGIYMEKKYPIDVTYDFIGHVNPWTVSNETLCIKSDPMGEYPECWGSVGNIFTGKAVDEPDIKKSMGIFLGNILAGVRPRSNKRVELFEVTSNCLHRGLTHLFPDHVEEKFSFDKLRLEVKFLAPRGFYGFLIEYHIVEANGVSQLVIFADPNPHAYATARSPRLVDYYWERENVNRIIDGNYAIAYSGQTAVVVASSDPKTSLAYMENGFELCFDIIPGKVVYVAFGFAFDGKESAVDQVRGLLSNPQEHFSDNQKFWKDFFAPIPCVSSSNLQKRLYWASWCSMTNVIESKYTTFNPAIVHHRAGCYCRIFSWDTLFAFVGLSITGAKEKAKELLKTYMRYNITSTGRSFMGFSLNGICDADAEFDFGFDFENKTKCLDNDLQPLYPWVVLEMMQNMNDNGFLDEKVVDVTIYDKILLYMNHVERDQEDPEDGLLIRDNTYESGWDNRKSPLFERGVKDKILNVQVFYLMSLESMVEICKIKGNDELVLKYSNKVEITRNSIIDKMWCEEHGAYEDIDIDDNLAHVLCLDTFLPLRFEKDETRRKRILAHLHNKEEFNLHGGLPTLAANDPDFNSSWGWRGNVWLAQVALVSLCMADGGLADEASELIAKHLDRYDMATNVGEHQDPYTGLPNGLAVGPFNWFGLFPIAALHIRAAGGTL